MYNYFLKYFDNVFFFSDLESAFFKKGCRNVEYNCDAFCGPKPVHNDNESLEALIMFAKEPNVDNKVAASVRFTDLIAEIALIN